MNRETEKLEFKVTLTKDVYKEVVAFANTEGGRLIIGMTDDGELASLSDVDGDYLKLTNGIRDNIRPDVTMFTKTKAKDDQTIHVEVEEGTHKPYYLKEKGLKPSGVYVRQGTSAAQASREQIRQMIKNADGDSFEEMRALNQELTFKQLKDVFEQNHREFDERKFSSLGITTINGDMYTNLGLIVSDQNPYTTKVAAFDDEENTIFKDRQEFTGSIFKQVDEILKYLNLHNNTKSIISGHLRYDYPAYSAEALREAVLNAVIHRDYAISDSNQIRINQSGMTIISVGALLPEIDAEDIFHGVSRLRNKNLANLFLRLNLIEAYGTGIGRIFNLYKSSPQKPYFDSLSGSFVLKLPNLNESVISFVKNKRFSTVKNFYTVSDVKMKVLIKDVAPKNDEFKELFDRFEGVAVTLGVDEREQSVLDYLEEYDEITVDEIQELLSMKRPGAFALVKQMSDGGLIRVTGSKGDRKVTLY